jgi:hypothetical protein
MSKQYQIEKLTVALDIIASSDTPLRSRLWDAWVSSLIRLKAEDFDGEATERWETINEFFDNCETDGNESGPNAISRNVPIEQCAKISSSIVWFLALYAT